jgi:hypothetical protein
LYERIERVEIPKSRATVSPSYSNSAFVGAYIDGTHASPERFMR